MRRSIWLAVALLLVSQPALRADSIPGVPLFMPCLAGQVIDYTANHGQDLRVFSEALQQPRDLYVYLPPGYDPKQSYPLMIYLHGYIQDEASFLDHLVGPLDEAIQCGQLPPIIVPAPDGTTCGYASRTDYGTFYINSRVGRYGDWIMNDVWNLVTTQYSVKPERESHVIAGVSMGGLGAYNQGLKHRDRFGIVIGIMPVINLRWVDCYGRYFGNFDPCCWGWRTSNCDGREVVGKFCHGLVKIRMEDALWPVFGCGPEAIAFASQENPIEIVERTNLQPGELDMYLGYAGKDEFNLDAQAESFLHVLHTRGIEARVNYSPWGRHNERTATSMLPDVIYWLGEKLSNR